MVISNLDIFLMLHKVGNTNCYASASIKRIYDLNVYWGIFYRKAINESTITKSKLIFYLKAFCTFGNESTRNWFAFRIAA